MYLEERVKQLENTIGELLSLLRCHKNGLLSDEEYKKALFYLVYSGEPTRQDIEAYNRSEVENELLPKVEEPKEELHYPLYWRHDGTDEVGIINNDDEYEEMMSIKSEIIDLISEEQYNELLAKTEAEEPKTKEPKAYTLDDVRAKVTEVMKADKTKKVALQGLLKCHGAERVSELKEEHFAAVIEVIEKGDY